MVKLTIAVLFVDPHRFMLMEWMSPRSFYAAARCKDLRIRSNSSLLENGIEIVPLSLEFNVI